ncbi:STAS domain-containing protein [Streptomyces sp. NBC_01314]|uniref:STAS domain-containing protein n=1 Tax=Streptomyces sp. NBC_01314 TaxID=2903821 RepID=UPI00308EE622|nr:STAS domain-containing protein [Streptomyces sp. NBC_01314]
MVLPQLNVYRHDRTTRALITLSGEIDLATAPLVYAALAGCLRDDIRTIDVDLTAVTFCDAGGLNAFLTASRLGADAGTTLRLHHPPSAMARVIEMTGCGFLLHGRHTVRPPSPRVPAVAGGAP